MPVRCRADRPGCDAGAVRDSTFGPLVMCGLDGIWAEGLADVAVRLASISPAEARSALDELRGRKVLDGLRGAPRVDIESLGHLITTLSTSVARAPWCSELDINPLLASGDRFVIVDARVRVEGQES